MIFQQLSIIINPGPAPGSSISEETFGSQRFIRLLNTAMESTSCQYSTFPQRTSIIQKETENSLYCNSPCYANEELVTSVNSTTTNYYYYYYYSHYYTTATIVPTTTITTTTTTSYKFNNVNLQTDDAFDLADYEESTAKSSRKKHRPDEYDDEHGKTFVPVFLPEKEKKKSKISILSPSSLYSMYLLGKKSTRLSPQLDI